MKLKKLLACTMAVALTTACVAGCGNTEKPTDRTQETAMTQENDRVSEEGAITADSEDMEEIVVSYPLIGTGTATAIQEVEDAVNTITESKINVHVTLKVLEVGSYAQQVNLMITSNEALDVVSTFPGGSASLSSMCSQKQLLPLNELIKEYGQDAAKNLGELLDATTMNGNIYSLTTYFNKAASVLVAMRTDLLEKYNLLEQAQNVKDMKDLEPIFDVILENEPGISPISGGMGGSVFSPGYVDLAADTDASVVYDALGDNNNLVAVDYSSDTPTVYNHYASESYKNACMMARDWYEKGYIYKDSTTTTEDADSLMRSGVIFSMAYKGGVDSLDAKRASTGYDLTIVEFNSIPISTGSCNVFTWGIPSTSKHPEAAMKFLNLLFSDEAINNLLAWGVKDVHYRMLEDGTADYLESQSAANCAYHTVDFLYGDNFSIYPWKGTAPDMRERQLDAMNQAETSPYLGFSLDTTMLQNEITAVTNVLEEYKTALEYGTIDPETELPNFIAKLEASGAQKIIDEAQRQLDAWLAQNQ